MSELKIIALLPPSNVDRLVGAVQQDLFARFGLLSSIALPVMIPIRFCAMSAGASDFKACFDKLDGAFRITATSYRKHETSLFLETTFDETGSQIWDLLAERLDELPSCPAAEPFDTASGFYLGQMENSLSPDKIIAALEKPPAFRFISFTYALIRLELDEPPERWYRNVFWEIEQSVKVRKSRSLRSESLDKNL